MEEVLGGGKEFSPREPQPGGVSTCGQLWRSPNPSADTDAWKGESPHWSWSERGKGTRMSTVGGAA